MGASINRLYVQSLDQPLPPQDTDDPQVYANKITRLADLVRAADAVVVGIGSGLSTASGYDFYHENELFTEAFGTFCRAHGFSTLFDGAYHVFSTNEEQWAFNAAVADFVAHMPVGEPYRQLARLLEGKEHFVLTSNVDGQVPRAFDEGRFWLFQGDMRYLQCSQPCHDEVVCDPERVEHLVRSTVVGEDGVPRIPADELPRCPECCRLMGPWVRDVCFLEGRLWREQKAAYESFLVRHLLGGGSGDGNGDGDGGGSGDGDGGGRGDSGSAGAGCGDGKSRGSSYGRGNNGGGKVLFLELGVSSMTPAVIKLPFWDMVARNPNAFYVDVNCAEASTPQQLGDRAMVVTADLARVLSDLAACF